MNLRKKENGCRLGHILQHIYDKEIVLEASHSTKRKALEVCLTQFKDFCMKTCPIFRNIFQQFYHTGSYFEGLRVREATEFDINVIFSLSQSDLEYEIEELDSLLSYATLQLKYSSTQSNERLLESLFDSEKFLVGNVVRGWFHSLVTSFLKHAAFNPPLVKNTHSGPARTLKLFVDSVWISIDLVPVFKINAEQVHKSEMKNMDISMDVFANCVLVPKPLSPELCCQMTSETSDRAWRIHFPDFEKNIIKKKDSLKPIVKLVKDLRDKEKWPIPSYFIKVVAIWLAVRNPDKFYWKNSRWGVLFLQIKQFKEKVYTMQKNEKANIFLESLEKHFCDKHLGHILYPTFNLLHSKRNKTLKILQMRLQKIISQLKKRPKKAYTLFKVYG